MTAKKYPVRLYRFFNTNKCFYGSSFAACDNCIKTTRFPSILMVEKIADKAVEDCVYYEQKGEKLK